MQRLSSNGHMAASTDIEMRAAPRLADLGGHSRSFSCASDASLDSEAHPAHEAGDTESEAEQMLSSESCVSPSRLKRPRMRISGRLQACLGASLLLPGLTMASIAVLIAVALSTGCSEESPLIKSDATVFGLLIAILHMVFETSESPVFQRFYRVVPSLLLCYFIPGVLGSAGVISSSLSALPATASNYLLPACLSLLTLGTNLAAISSLGRKAVIMFFLGALGVMLGGPLAMLAVAMVKPEAARGDTWKALACVAGSWIGGSANQLAMKEVFEVSDATFAKAVAVDVFVSNLWMAVLLLSASNAKTVDGWLRADSSSIAQLSQSLEEHALEATRAASFRDYVSLALAAFGVTGLSTWLGDAIATLIREHAPLLGSMSLASPFFWLVLLAGAGGLLLSFTPAQRLEGAGASKLGTLMLYIMIATIGMRMDFRALAEAPGMIAIGLVWISVHGVVMVLGAIALRSPVFFLAVGSQANIGGAASAPVVAAAFNPNLATIGVLLAVLGYSTGTALAWLTGLAMKFLAGVL